MTEYTELELRQAAQRAYDAGNMESAARLVRAAREAAGRAEQAGISRPEYDAGGEVAALRPPRVEVQEAPLPAQPEPQESRSTAGDAALSFGSGITRGGAWLADTPGQLMNLFGTGAGMLVQRGVETVMGDNAPEWTNEIPGIISASNPLAPSGQGRIEEGVRMLPGGEAAMDYLGSPPL